MRRIHNKILRRLFKRNKPLLVAEISANHNGSLSKAKKLIECAKKNGADIVKLQTYTPETMTIKSNKKDFKIQSGLWKGNTLWELYSKAQTPFKWQKILFDHAKKKKILCFSTPFDETAVKLLEKINCPFYKIASFEMTDIPLIKEIAKTKKPVIISTGLASLKEIEYSIKNAKKYGIKDIIVLYCVSSYPAKLEDFNLNNINILKKKFNCIVGFSDHSTDNKVAESAVAMGAEIIEKHIGLENQKDGLDIEFSLKGKKIKKFKEGIVKTYNLMGKNYFYRSKKENKNIKYRRSIYVTKNVKKGEKFNKYNIRTYRPKIGVGSEYFETLIGKKSKKNISKFTPIFKNVF